MNPLINAGIEMGWHSVKRTFSVIATLLLIAGLGWLIYVGMIRPHTKGTFQNKQDAEQIINYTIEPRQTFFGCANFRIQKPDIKPKEVNK